MLPTSSKVPDRFTPEGSETTFLIEVPTFISKARYFRTMTALGTRIWSKDAMVACAREEISHSAPENQADLLAVCDRYDAVSAETDLQASAAIMSEWARLARTLQGSGGDFAARVADNEYWQQMAPLTAARCFMLGTDAVRLKRGADGLIPEETLANVCTAREVVEIGARALELFTPSEAEAKNSASPQPSPSGPASSTAASNPQTEATGTSSETATAETQG